MALQDRRPADDSYVEFIHRAVEDREVWGLRSHAGWAVCDSLDYANRSVVPFWSSRAQAQRAAIDDWATYEATPIALSRFMGAWLVEMGGKRILAGINWDAMNCGLEVEPDDLTEQLKRADRK
jgi:hypothetical protein